MKRIVRTVLFGVLVGLMPAGLAVAAPGSQRAKSAVTQTPSAPVPPYHKGAQAARALPRVLPASQFAGHPLIARAYQIASQIPTVLAQQPCYCHCDREFGHSSLLDCFASTHTAGCGICMGETFFAYQMTKEGKKPAEIRAAIIRGDWKTTRVDPFK